MNELYSLAFMAFLGPVTLDEEDCGVKYTPEGFRPNCEESEVYHSKWDSNAVARIEDTKTFTEYAFRGANATVLYPGGDNNQGHKGNPPTWAGPPGGFICPPPFRPCPTDDPHDPMYPSDPPTPEVPSVPLPAAVWMLLVAVGSLISIKRFS